MLNDDCYIEIDDSMKLEPLDPVDYEDLKDFIFEEIRKILYARRIIMRVSLDKGAFPPERAHPTDAGLDLKTPVDFVVPAGGWAIVDTGVHVELPNYTCGMLKSKSGLNVRYGITGTGLIDEGFTGSIKVRLYNHGSEDYRFKAGEKVTQLAVIPCLYPDIEIVDQIQGGERGENGYGSSGK